MGRECFMADNLPNRCHFTDFNMIAIKIEVTKKIQLHSIAPE